MTHVPDLLDFPSRLSLSAVSDIRELFQGFIVKCPSHRHLSCTAAISNGVQRLTSELDGEDRRRSVNPWTQDFH